MHACQLQHQVLACFGGSSWTEVMALQQEVESFPLPSKQG